MGISEDLGATGIAVQDGFLDAAQVRALRDSLHERRTRGDFSAARIGSDATLQENPAVRGDRTCWLCEPLFVAERELRAGLERLRTRLNQDLYLGLFELELHYAWYPPGAGYARHVDHPRGSTARRVSLILYLNEAWQAEAGGELELYDGPDKLRRFEPLAGRLVCFLTAGREHAVLAAHRDRFSISGWYRVRSGDSPHRAAEGATDPGTALPEQP
jgi:SM-20-related protein